MGIACPIIVHMHILIYVNIIYIIYVYIYIPMPICIKHYYAFITHTESHCLGLVATKFVN